MGGLVAAESPPPWQGLRLHHAVLQERMRERCVIFTTCQNNPTPIMVAGFTPTFDTPSFLPRPITGPAYVILPASETDG
jgi:hypothetical protein